MCDEQTEKDIEKYIQAGKLSRREFGKFSALVGLATVFPQFANATGAHESEVQVKTPDGMADCYFAHPASGKHPGIILWPDIRGIRPAFKAMGRRLAESGYAVLVVNPYYRSKPGLALPEGVSFRSEEGRAVIMPMRKMLTPEAIVTDTKAFVSFLDDQDVVDTGRKIGAAGYCMSGPFVMRAAAAMAERVGAVASFHGGGLVTDKPDSPHLLIPQTTAQVLHAIAESDDERKPTVKDDLRRAYANAGIAAEIKVYAGTAHGWCPPDSRAYNEEQADRAWGRLLALYEKAL